MALSPTAGSAVLQVRTPPNGPNYTAQEPGDKGEPDIERPPDSDIPEFDSDHADTPNRPPRAPPFTGADVEDVGRRRERDRPSVM
jgi:hypothetical protein